VTRLTDDSCVVNTIAHALNVIARGRGKLALALKQVCHGRGVEDSVYGGANLFPHLLLHTDGRRRYRSAVDRRTTPTSPIWHRREEGIPLNRRDNRAHRDSFGLQR
jgi:hypothetical protein